MSFAQPGRKCGICAFPALKDGVLSLRLLKAIVCTRLRKAPPDPDNDIIPKQLPRSCVLLAPLRAQVRKITLFN